MVSNDFLDLRDAAGRHSIDTAPSAADRVRRKKSSELATLKGAVVNADHLGEPRFKFEAVLSFWHLSPRRLMHKAHKYQIINTFCERRALRSVPRSTVQTRFRKLISF
jgi:hypothetical protein